MYRTSTNKTKWSSGSQVFLFYKQLLFPFATYFSTQVYYTIQVFPQVVSVKYDRLGGGSKPHYRTVKLQHRVGTVLSQLYSPPTQPDSFPSHCNSINRISLDFNKFNISFNFCHIIFKKSGNTIFRRIQQSCLMTSRSLRGRQNETSAQTGGKLECFLLAVVVGSKTTSLSS